MAEHGEMAYGLVPILSFLVSEGPMSYLTSPHDVHDVKLALQVLGLPMELVLHVMRLADYYPQQKLNVPHDPLHPGNREELEGSTCTLRHGQGGCGHGGSVEAASSQMHYCAV